jgi:hypothetical protein
LLKKKIQKEMLMNMHINLEELNKRTKIWANHRTMKLLRNLFGKMTIYLPNKGILKNNAAHSKLFKDKEVK